MGIFEKILLTPPFYRTSPDSTSHKCKKIISSFLGYDVITVFNFVVPLCDNDKHNNKSFEIY